MRRFQVFCITIGVIAIIAIAAWATWQVIAFRPEIASVDLIRPGDTSVVLKGNGFGTRPGMVILQPGDIQAEVIDWRPEQVVIQRPEHMAVYNEIILSREFLFAQRQSQPQGFALQAEELPSDPYGYEVPTQADSPWPTFRRDHRNTGRSPIVAQYDGSQPWEFRTAKGIFSTPVIDRDGRIYFGSADHFFYALNPDGTLAWKFQTGEIIDSAGAIGRFDPNLNDSPITFISGDGNMYHFRTAPDISRVEDREIWRYQAELRPEVSYNRWFEGNVAIGFDGTLFAGNTNFLYYAINPDGTLKWTYPTGSNNWSQAAFNRDGNIAWGSVDTFVHGVSPAGRGRWTHRTLGFIAASAAIGSDGTIYIGSFDSNLYALDPATGAIRWTFGAQDHIYASVALGEDSSQKTNAIYLASADGFLYALTPNGDLRWKFDAGDPIRSSPAVGLAPDGQSIVYFGCGNGKLFAVNAGDGSLRWSFDTTPVDPELADRNDLNSSPALGKTGIAIGGEHGSLWFIPYDYCLNAQNDRCGTEKKNSIPDITELRYVSPGGSLQDQFPVKLPSSASITLRLLVKRGGETVNARLCNNPFGCSRRVLDAQLEPPAPFELDHSADGRFLYIRPTGFLSPGQYRLSVSGEFYVGGARIGNLTLGGKRAGRFQDSFSFEVEENNRPFPLAMEADRVTALEWTRLAAPLPTMLPSLNQIGFDYIDWIVGPARISPSDGDRPRRVILWAVGAVQSPSGELIADSRTDFLLPLTGSFQGDAFILANQDFKMPITGIDIPFNRFEMRGEMPPSLVVRPNASLFADTEVLSIPTFGPYLVVAGLANNWYQKMLVSGTYITRPYPESGPAARKPQGVSVIGLFHSPPTDDSPGTIRAKVQIDPGSEYPVDLHRASILLIDPVEMQAVSLDYLNSTKMVADSSGNLQEILLEIPRETQLPKDLEAVVMLDVFPAYSQRLSE